MIAGILFKEISHLFSFFLDLDYNEDWYWNLGIVVIIFYVGIWGYSQIQPSGMDYSKNDITDSSNGKDSDLTTWRPKIQRLMEEEKAYLEPQLSLKKMAQKLRTNPGILSAAINQNFGKNFNDFVNEFRVNEFLEKSKQTEFKHYTLLALALDSGFNSKSTFNRSFKKITGRAPTEIEKR